MAGNTVKDLHVAIVGAGIGGLALAMALHKKNVPFTVYEEASQHSVVGAGIGFGPNGLRAMQLIEEQFLSKYESVCVGNKPVDAQHVFFEGLLLQEGLGRKEDWYGHSSWGHPKYVRKSVRSSTPFPRRLRTILRDHQAHRKALLDIMTSFIPIDNVRFNKRMTKIQQHADKVVLTFADGEVVEASAVAGSDGIQSVVREHVLEHSYPDQVEPVYADSYCYRGVIPIAEAEDILGDLVDVAKFYFGNKRSCVTYRISGGEEFNFLLCAAADKPWPQKKDVTEKVAHEEMMADFEGRGVDSRFLQLLSKAKPIRWGFFHHRQTSTYCRNRVALVGDSAHASLPFQAAGASQALEDAVVLAEVLADIATIADKDAPLGPYIHAALDGYDSVRRPRAQRQLEQSAEVALMIHFQHPEAGSDMSKILPRLQQGRFDWLWFHDIKEDVQRASQRMKDIVNA